MNRNRTQEEIDYEAKSFELEVVELRKDMHDNCDMNNCNACVPNYSMQDIKNIAIELDHATKHKIPIVKFRN